MGRETLDGVVVVGGKPHNRGVGGSPRCSSERLQAYTVGHASLPASAFGSSPATWLSAYPPVTRPHSMLPTIALQFTSEGYTVITRPCRFVNSLSRSPCCSSCIPERTTPNVTCCNPQFTYCYAPCPPGTHPLHTP